MKIEDIKVGQAVRTIGTKMEFIVVGMYKGADGGALVYCDHEDNDGELFMFTPNEIELI